MINYKKINSKTKSNENFLKISLKDIGGISNKKYSSIIVDEIKLDFSISLYKTGSINRKINNQKIDNINIASTIDKTQNQSNDTNNVTKENKENNIFNKKVIEQHEAHDNTDNNIFQNNSYSNQKTNEHIEKNPSIQEVIKSQQYNINNQNKNTILKTNKRTNNTKYNKNTNTLLSQLISSNDNTYSNENLINADEIFLSPVNYEKYISEKNKPYHETFCEGFFIASFPLKNGQVVEKSQSFPALCGHEECSSLPSMKPEIIYRYPLKDTKTMELNNLSATICFPTGIKVCYNEKGPGLIKDYITPITNQKGERYYMITFHYYLKMETDVYNNKYEMHPLKDHLKRFADNYLNLKEKDISKKKEKIEQDLEQAQNLGFRDYVYVPFCICLISKYPYTEAIKNCLQSIYYLIINKKEKNDLYKLIMYLINSVPIPEKETLIQFYIPYYENEIEIKCPKLNDLKIVNSTISNLLKLFSIDLIIYIFRFLLFEKKILFIDDDYTRLSNVTDNFISLLYPFQWMHTYIPIMSDQMIPYLETFLPFLNGINTSLLSLVKDLYQIGDMEQNEEIFLVYIKENKLNLGTSLINKKGIKINKYIEKNVPELPSNLEKGLKYKLKKIKDEIDYFEKKNPGNNNLETFDLKIRNAFIEVFVQMFHDIDKYLCYLDDDIIFNKNLFLETVHKDDRKFYNEFIDTQLFQLFTQNIVKDESSYFKTMLEEYNKNNGKFINDKIMERNNFDIKKIYIISPDYLDINDKDKNLILEKMNEKYILSEEEFDDKRITEYMENIEEKNYENNNLNVYIIPKEKEPEIKYKKTFSLLNNILTNKNSEKIVLGQMKKYIRIKQNMNEMSQKEQDELKERIKDFTIKIFKSEELNTKDNNLIKEMLNDINTNIGREFFVNLLSKNTTNIILLKNDFFILLGTLIYNTLLSIIPLDENEKILEQIVRLIKSLKYFGKEEKETIGFIIRGEIRSTITLWNIYKQKIQTYPKVNQTNLWFKWYQISLTNEKNRDDINVKKNIILDMCKLMVEIELDNIFIKKKTLEELVKIVFSKNEEKQNETLNEIQEIILSHNKK